MGGGGAQPGGRKQARTKVAIIGAGPAGLLLAAILRVAGVDTVVFESRDRSYVEKRQRAGLLEQGTVEALRSCGAAGRLDREGLVHEGLELRFAGAGHRVPLTELTGRTVTIYAQTEIVKDLIELGVAAGADIRFSTPVVSLDLAAPSVTYRTPDGATGELACDMIAGCDGFHGVARAAVPVRTYEHEYPFAWLGVLADAPPSTDELIYAHSPRGFALHSMRSPRVGRLYLQVPPDEDIARWDDDRIWAELAARFAVSGGTWTLTTGPILEKSVTPMRSFVAEPMRYGPLFLAGDAAHIVPPTGAKGLNLAVSDVTLLARALTAWYATGDAGPLDAYSATCLDRVWRAEHFSYWMTTLLHLDPAADDYARRLQLSHLSYVASSTAALTSLAENYAGLPPPD